MSRTTKSLPTLAADYIRKNGMISAGDHVLAAVSGGPDSVALISVLYRLKNILGIERLTVIHFNHRLRGEEAEADMEFVRHLALSFGVGFRCAEADVRSFARSRKISLEMAARECRRSFFMAEASGIDSCKIALGHTLDDQAEEVILRILRGTGPAGIQAMSPLTPEGIIRPLLFATRHAVLDYLRECGLGFRIDSTNLSASCQRNFIRLKVFPLMREAFHPQIAKTIARCADLVRDEESWWTLKVQELWGGICLESWEGGCSLDFGRVKQLHPALMRRLLRWAVHTVKGDLAGVGLVHLGPLGDLVLSGKTGKSVRLPGGIEAVRNGPKLLITSIEPEAASEEILRISEPGNYSFDRFGFEIRFHGQSETCCSPDAGPDCVCMDSDKLEWPLEIRFRRPGDRFHPLGMSGSKKLQDFFVDRMVPRQERKKVPLLCDRGKICWVAGMRLDERVRVGPHTSKVVSARLIRPGPTNEN